MGIEPTYPAWKAGVLPLNYTRKYSVERAIDGARTRGLDLGKVARYQLRHYRISGWWESNPRIQLGRLVFYHWTTPAQLVVCASLSHQRRLVYMMKLYLSTLNLNFFYFFNNIYNFTADKQFFFPDLWQDTNKTGSGIFFTSTAGYIMTSISL